jgi:hypothetical protein
VSHSCPNVTGFVPEKATPRHERYETPIEGDFVTGFVPCLRQFFVRSFRAQALPVSCLAIVGGEARRAMMASSTNWRRSVGER